MSVQLRRSERIQKKIAEKTVPKVAVVAAKKAGTRSGKEKDQANKIAKLKKELADAKKRPTQAVYRGVVAKFHKEEKKAKEQDVKLKALAKENAQNIRILMEVAEEAQGTLRTLEEQQKLIKESVAVTKKLEKDKMKLEHELKEKSEMADVKKAEQMLNKEREKSKAHREKMLDLRKMLEQKEKGNGAVMPWKTCEICAFEYSDEPDRTPRVLGCGHTVCEECGRNLSSGSLLRCPFDRIFTCLPDGDVKQLQKNFTILHM
ncbi:unnamed protein product [Caenorhabditis sp. 36 PRJEB53466]|nr:unnamed protein product [Caenorhabditis sp. 36 PRJEB53466]